MRDPPDIESLLALAEGAEDAMLAARCRAIAARERATGLAPYRAIAAELGDDLAGLAADIRRGRFDAPGPERQRLTRLLWRLALLKLRENNPAFEVTKI